MVTPYHPAIPDYHVLAGRDGGWQGVNYLGGPLWEVLI